jgi:hypothetical protein
MDATQLRRDLDVAHYRWARQTFENEIHGEFPLLGLFERGIVPRLLAFFKSLSIEEQLRYAGALVRRRNTEAVIELGEAPPVEDRHLIYECREVISIPTASELERDLHCDVPVIERGRDAREKLRCSLIDALYSVLGHPAEKRGEDRWIYRTHVQGWSIETEIDTGGHSHALSYHHKVQANLGPCVKSDISLLSLLGISSQTSWCDVRWSECSTTARALSRLCAEYLNAKGDLLPQPSKWPV